LPKDAADERNAILEIRAGTGGDEAALFAGDLFRMYERYAQNSGLAVRGRSSESEGEMPAATRKSSPMSGKGVFARLKYESGVHRVQRVPETEGAGPHPHLGRDRGRAARSRGGRHRDPRRGHPHRHLRASAPAASTSTPPIRPCASPICRPASSSPARKNRSTRTAPSHEGAARAPLRHGARARRIPNAPPTASQVGSGDRSERIRTYNFPQGRVTDHRINLTLYKLDRIMEGDLDEIIDALIARGEPEFMSSTPSGHTGGTAPPSVLSDISPQGGRSAGRTDFANRRRCKTGVVVDALDPPLVGEMSDRTEGGNVERQRRLLVSSRDEAGRSVHFCSAATDRRQPRHARP
jgi:peptide chain release factor 1